LPPTLLLAAGNDRWVHPARAAAIADLLIAAGVDCRYLVVPFADHGFDGREDSFGAQLEAGIVPAFVREVAR
jgi:dienelactone hydrolase